MKKVIIYGSLVLDLFAGSGNLGIEAISNGASEVYFIDINPVCIKVIKENIRMFNIENECNVIKKELLDLIKGFDILSDNGIVVYEYQDDERALEYQGFRLLKDKKYGDKYVSIYKRVVE